MWHAFVLCLVYHRVKSSVGQTVFLCGGSEEKSTAKLIWVIGRIQSHSQLLEAARSSLPHGPLQIPFHS